MPSSQADWKFMLWILNIEYYICNTFEGKAARAINLKGNASPADWKIMPKPVLSWEYQVVQLLWCKQGFFKIWIEYTLYTLEDRKSKYTYFKVSSSSKKQASCRQIVNQIRDFLPPVISIASFFVAIKCNQHLAMHCCNQEMAAIAVSSEQAIVSNLVHFQSLVFLAEIPCALCNTRINARFGGIQFVNYLWPVKIPNIQVCKCIIWGGSENAKM